MAHAGDVHGGPDRDRWTTTGSNPTKRRRTGAAREQQTASGFARGLNLQQANNLNGSLARDAIANRFSAQGLPTQT